MNYVENYYNLSHGTDMISAQNIYQNGFEIKGSQNSWCGKGVYFYDIKSKAWWAANRKCEEIKKTTGNKVKPNVVFADIKNISKKEIFDLRVKNDLDSFAEFVGQYLDGTTRINIEDVEDETERKILLRAMLISFFADKEKRKLIIGNFRQRPQQLYTKIIEFANSLDIVFGIETIYCVKDTNVISNIHFGENN